MQTPFDVLDTYFGILSFVMGGMIGSFLNVCIYRLPRNESIVHPRSRCPKCGKAIAWYDNVPILSWVVLGGRCRHCRQVISWQYALVEGLTGALFVCVYWRFGATAASPIYMVLMAGLVLVTFVDLSDWTIPNEVTFPGIPLGIACSVLGMFYPASGLLVTDVFDALIGAVCGGAVLYFLDKIALVAFKKRGMGMGDVKLMAMLGAFLGWKSVIFILTVASLLGSVFGLAMIVIGRRGAAEVTKAEGGEEKKGEATGHEELDVATLTAPGAHYLPFGPYLVVAGILFVFFGEQLIGLYLGLIQAPEPSTTILPILR